MSPKTMTTMSREEEEIAALAAIELQNRAYKDDFWLWCIEQVYTSDEATQKTLPFPADKAYLKDLSYILQNIPKVAIPKSRRLFISWIVALYCQWRARFHPNNAIFFQSEKEEKSAYIIDKRICFVEKQISPFFQRPYDELKTKSGLVGRITYRDTGSYVWGVAQGDSQIRSYTPSILVMDECEFMSEGPQALAAALATVEKSAQIILISTSNGPGHPLASIAEGAGFLRWKE
jgi:hypothetical protein